MAGKRVLVVGDVMLDEYIFGSATRISPEAPVMVIRKSHHAHVPGGAANVAKNVVALGGQAQLIGLIGEDEAGSKLLEGFAAIGLDLGGLVRDASRPTTRKTRVVANSSHQVLRIDEEANHAMDAQVRGELLAMAESLIGAADAILLSDYQKGCLDPEAIEALVNLAHRSGKAVLGNAKPKSAPAYAGATLVSLNRPETMEALGLDELPADAGIAAAKALVQKFGVLNALVTLGRHGMAAYGEALPAGEFVAAPNVEVADPAGAGDTVIATVALGIAAAGLTGPVLELATQTSSAVVRHVGVAVPSPEDLERIRGV